MRDLREPELDWLAAMEREIFGVAAWSASLIRDDWRHGSSRYRVLEMDGEPAGYSVYGFEGDAFHLLNIAILEEFRGRRLSRMLMDDFLAEGVRLRAPEAWLEVAVNNDAARALYVSYGFTLVRIRAKYYQPEGVDGMVMMLPLATWSPRVEP